MVGSATSAGTRFRILRSHAEGGLGKVSVARDQELSREVALKEIKPRHADNPESRARFLREAEITGGLEHPGIVPVYGLGQYGDGRPYYAMRLIRGDSLKEAVDRYHDLQATKANASERAVELRKLLGRFIDVCNAIAYAHSRGVLHRDLKPGNIMLGQYGETLVVDWGLAKVVGQTEASGKCGEMLLTPSSGNGSAATQMGSTLGTPQYMSPEQAAGRLDSLGPTSDVYSLGATLYYVLTGRRPIDSYDIGTVLKKVQRGEFRPPRALNPEIARSLEAICLKAMRLKPEDRYPSPKALADDVERWLAAEPVTAYRESSVERLLRWGRKHRTLVHTTVAILAIAVVALGVGSVLINAERSRTEQANQKIKETNAELTAAMKLAESGRDQARRRFQLALDAINDLVFGIQNKLESRPGTEDLRKELLEKARQGMQKLLPQAERQGNPDSTLMWSYLRMGDLEKVLGNTLAEKREYEAGCELAAKLAAADPQNTRAQCDLTISYQDVGDATLMLGDAEKAIGFYEKAVAIDERLAAADAMNSRVQFRLSEDYKDLGNATLCLGRLEEARDFYRKSLALFEHVAAAEPNQPDVQLNFGLAYHKLGDVMMRLGHPSESLDFYEKSLAIVERLAAADPRNPRIQNNLGVAYLALGGVNLRLAKTSEALGFFQKALVVVERLAAADPKNNRSKVNLCVVYAQLGNVTLQLGRTQDSIDFSRKAVEVGKHLTAADPGNAETPHNLIAAYLALGDAEGQSGQLPESLASYQAALAILERLAAANPKNVETQSKRMVCYSKFGNVAAKMHDLVKAAEWYKKALDVAKQFEKSRVFAKEAAILNNALAKCRTIEDVVADVSSASKLPAALQAPVLAEALNFSIARHDPVKARQLAEALARLTQPDDFYNAACGFARLSPSGDKETREQDARRAMELLQQAVAKGFKDVSHMKQDKDLDSLHERGDFKKLIAAMEDGKR